MCTFLQPHTSQIDTCRSNYRPGNYCARLLLCPTLWYRILDGGTDWNLASSNEASDCIYIGTLPRRLLETIDQQEAKLEPMAYRTKTSLSPRLFVAFRRKNCSCFSVMRLCIMTGMSTSRVFIATVTRLKKIHCYKCNIKLAISKARLWPAARAHNDHFTRRWLQRTVSVSWSLRPFPVTSQEQRRIMMKSWKW